MSVGLLALLDDVAAIVKVTAASLDDVITQAAKAGTKVAGVVIDDAAVTPKYVIGLSPARELPIVWNITKGSLKNKLFFLLPAALLLGWIAPFVIQPLLAMGGLFLCFEGYEKLHSIFHNYFHATSPSPIDAHTSPEIITPEALETMRTSGAIRTDFILSAEIMAITYATVAEEPLLTKSITLALVAIGITIAVYGFVAIIVKADDVGYHFAKGHYPRWLQTIGRGVVKSMPPFLTLLGYVGTAAMLWVGGGIILHSIPFLHHIILYIVEMLYVRDFIAWLCEAILSSIFGIIAGAVAAVGVRVVQKIRHTW